MKALAAILFLAAVLCSPKSGALREAAQEREAAISEAAEIFGNP